MMITEKFTEQCLKSTYLKMLYSEMLPDNSLEHKSNMAVVVKQILGHKNILQFKTQRPLMVFFRMQNEVENNCNRSLDWEGEGTERGNRWKQLMTSLELLSRTFFWAVWLMFGSFQGMTD